MAFNAYNRSSISLSGGEYVSGFVNTPVSLMGPLREHFASVAYRSASTTHVLHQQGTQRPWKSKLHRYLFWLLILNGGITAG